MSKTDVVAKYLSCCIWLMWVQSRGISQRFLGIVSVDKLLSLPLSLLSVLVSTVPRGLGVIPTSLCRTPPCTNLICLCCSGGLVGSPSLFPLPQPSPTLHPAAVCLASAFLVFCPIFFLLGLWFLSRGFPIIQVSRSLWLFAWEILGLFVHRTSCCVGRVTFNITDNASAIFLAIFADVTFLATVPAGFGPVGATARQCCVPSVPTSKACCYLLIFYDSAAGHPNFYVFKLQEPLLVFFPQVDCGVLGSRKEATWMLSVSSSFPTTRCTAFFYHLPLCP